MTAREAYAKVVSTLAAAGVESPQAEAWLMLGHLTGMSRARLLTDTYELDGTQERRLGEWLARRSLREPLQLILGSCHFYGLELTCEPGVLIPRPETERLVEIALQLVADTPSPRILDVGTGTGAVALALASERPDAVLLASDISERSVDLARRNARALDLPVEVLRGSLLETEALSGFAAAAHLIVSNPPYLPAPDREGATAEVRWDPDGALYAGQDGLTVFRELATQAHALLQPGRTLLVELDPRNVDAAARWATGWHEACVHEDLTGRRRFLELRR